MNYWICTKCGKLFPIDNIKGKHELYITGENLNIPINLCSDCFNQLYLHKLTTFSNKAKYPILTVAHYLIDIAQENKNPINSYDLNKVMFLIWIDYYKNYQEWLFDDFFITNSSGPSFKKVLNKYCCYAAMPITLTIGNNKDYYIFDEKDKKFLKEKLKYYQQFNFFELKQKCQEFKFNWSNTKNILDEHTYGLGDIISQI